jgi:hypothetical protein
MTQFNGGTNEYRMHLLPLLQMCAYYMRHSAESKTENLKIKWQKMSKNKQKRHCQW